MRLTGPLFGGLSLSPLFVLIACSPLLASPGGSIRGSIKDPSGAPIARAKIAVDFTDQRESRSTFSDAAGIFEFPALTPGVWKLSVDAASFRRAVSPRVIVDVDQTTEADFTLEIGAEMVTVNVEGLQPTVERERSTLSHVVDQRTIASLPLNARQFLDLALLTPGTVPAPPGTQGAGFNNAGMRSQSNVYLLDGVSNLDTQTNQPLNLFRITDAVSEFDVQTGVPTPEFGRGAGAQVNIVTKTGGDTFHGSLFEYARNTVLNASDFFTNKLSGVKGVLNRNQFGATAGGPILRDRTFFFVSYEGFRQAARTVSSTLVPSLAQRSAVTDPVSQRLLAFWPLPNTAGSLNYISNVPNLDSDNTVLIRGDHRIGTRDQVSAHWVGYFGSSTVAGPTPLTGGNQGPQRQVSAMLDETHTFSPNLLQDFRAGFSRYSLTRTVQDSGVNADAIFGSPGAPVDAGLPFITIGGGFAALGTNANFPQGRISNTTELFDNLSWSEGSRHTLRWGIHARREDLSRYLNRSERGSINFASFGDFTKGQLNSATIRTGSTQAYWRRYPWDVYFQDDFRISKDLTVNYGLRYEYPSAVAESRNHAVNFVPGYGPMIDGTNQILIIDPAKQGPAALTYKTAPFTLPDSGMYPDRNNFAPMIGFAWAPGAGQTVLRGGFRVAYDDLFNNVPSSMALNAPANLQTTQTANVTQPGKFPWSLAFDQNVPLVSNYGLQAPGTPQTGILTFQSVDPHLRSAYAYIYHFGLQHGIGKSLVLAADYQGSSGHDLGVYIDVNQPAVIVRDPGKRGTIAPNEQVFPYNQFGQAQIAKSIGSSNYNGLIATAKYRGRKTFVEGSYTLGKSLDYNSSYFGSGSLPGETGAPIDARNLRLEHGPSAFDVRQRFLLTYVIDLPMGWALSGITTVQSGMPFTIVTGGPDSSGFNQATSGISPDGGNRPNLAKLGPVPQNNGNPDAAFDPTWFTAALAGQDGNSGRNQYYGPGVVNVDLSAANRWRLPLPGERTTLEFRADFFNLFNHTNFANPIADMSNASFGKITQSLGTAVATSVGTSGGPTGGPRLIQLSLRLQF
jgi:hypothetical protein